jgi:hypothetical protein
VYISEHDEERRMKDEPDTNQLFPAGEGRRTWIDLTPFPTAGTSSTNKHGLRMTHNTLLSVFLFYLEKRRFNSFTS